MAKITTLEQRYTIKRMVESGHTSRAIAEAMGLSTATVKKWRRRIREGRLDSTLGRPRRGALSSFDTAISAALERWRKAHPGWGPTTLELELKLNSDAAHLPSRASIGRFLQEKGLTRTYEPHAGVAQVKPLDTEHPHHRWQVDAEGNRQIESVGTIALINVKDVHSRTYIGSYPALLKSRHSHPTTDHYQSALRVAFAEFGRPDQLQVDHASVFYDNTTKSAFPTRLHLWLAALGIKLCFSRVRRATDQAHVERTHQTMVQQVIDGARFNTWEHLAQRLSQRRQTLNAFYPCTSLHGQAPLQAFPEAAHNGRPYYPEKELDMLDLERAYALIALGTYFRRVSKDRNVRLGRYAYHLPRGRPYQQLRIEFDACSKHLIFHNDKEQFIGTKPIKGIDCETLMGPLWPYGQLPSFQLPIPFDWQSHITANGIRLFETVQGLRDNKT